MAPVIDYAVLALELDQLLDENLSAIEIYRLVFRTEQPSSSSSSSSSTQTSSSLSTMSPQARNNTSSRCQSSSSSSRPRTTCKTSYRPSSSPLKRVGSGRIAKTPCCNHRGRQNLSREPTKESEVDEQENEGDIIVPDFLDGFLDEDEMRELGRMPADLAEEMFGYGF